MFAGDELVVVYEGDAHAIVNDSTMVAMKLGKATPRKPEGSCLG
jgi:hypothetical protein